MTDDELQCPQCRSENITHTSPLGMAECGYCGEDFYPLEKTDLLHVLSDLSKLELPSFKNPLTIREVQERNVGARIFLVGMQNAEYRLDISAADGTVTLYRRKSPSERNQFGSRWKRESRNIRPSVPN